MPYAHSSCHLPNWLEFFYLHPAQTFNPTVCNNFFWLVLDIRLGYFNLWSVW